MSNKDALIPSYANVSDDYILNVGTNLGVNTARFNSAINGLRTARRAADNAKTKSGQEKSSAQRQLKEAEEKFEKERAKLIDDINRKNLNSR